MANKEKGFNVHAFVLTIIYFIVFLILCFFAAPFNVAFWVEMLFLYVVPIVASLCVNDISWRSIGEGIMAVFLPFISFYLIIKEVEFGGWSSVVFIGFGFIMLCVGGIIF